MSARACPNCRKQHIRCSHKSLAKSSPRQKPGTACHYCKIVKVKCKCLTIPSSLCLRCKRLGYDCKPQDTSKVKAESSSRAPRTQKTHAVTDKSTGALHELDSTTDEQPPQVPSLLPVYQDSGTSEQSGDVYLQNLLEPVFEFIQSGDVSPQNFLEAELEYLDCYLALFI